MVAIQPLNIVATGLAFQFDFTASVWSRVRINFLASNNNQLQLGSFNVANVQVSNGFAYAYTNIAQAFPQSASPVIRVFINGYDVASPGIVFSTSPTNLQGTKLTIKITLPNSTNLKRAWFSYLAFAPATTSFGSYGGSFSRQAFQGSSSSDISNILYQTSYLLYGLFELSISGNQPIAFTSSIDNNFVLTVASSRAID